MYHNFGEIPDKVLLSFIENLICSVGIETCTRTQVKVCCYSTNCGNSQFPDTHLQTLNLTGTRVRSLKAIYSSI